eukprot:1592385-Pyramimonas_sp.AAC.1
MRVSSDPASWHGHRALGPSKHGAKANHYVYMYICILEPSCAFARARVARLHGLSHVIHLLSLLASDSVGSPAQASEPCRRGAAETKKSVIPARYSTIGGPQRFPGCFSGS